MLRKVYLEGTLGSKFIPSFEVEAETLQDVFRCADANFSEFRPYMIDCMENETGFSITVENSEIIDENQLLLPMKKGDIIITPIPAGSKGIGKIIAAIAIMYVVIATGGQILAAQGGVAPSLAGPLTGPAITMKSSFMAAIKAGGLKGFGLKMLAATSVHLGMAGLTEMMAPDPATDSDQESSYMFNGDEQNIIEGDPVPVLYGHLRVPGQPISFDVISSSYNPITGNNVGLSTGWPSRTRELNTDLAQDSAIN
jgi:predicted phage tail protein